MAGRSRTVEIRLNRREVIRLLGWSLIMTHQASAAADPQGRMPLPAPRFDGQLSIERGLRLRRSVREYLRGPLTLAEASQLLWAAQGTTDPSGLRTAPSAGALYPIEICLVAGEVTNLPPGIHRYDPGVHALNLVAAGDKRAALSAAAFDQTFIRTAAITLVFSAVYRRTAAKYGERAVRYVHMEAGHAAQNVYLQAASLHLGTVAVGAFHDDRVRQIIGAASEEQPLYIMPIGRL